MRHKVKKLDIGKDSKHRRAMMRNMATDLFSREYIKTTITKAKVLKPFVEKLISRSRQDSLHNRRMIYRNIKNTFILKKLFAEIGPRFQDRPGGYTRLLKLERRKGDGAELALLQLLPKNLVQPAEKQEK